MPSLQSEVSVYGFPLGGDALSITKGVISRIENTNYSHSSMDFLAIQIDAAINPGNSGGPGIHNGKIVGIAMQGYSSAENIGYLIPTNVIKHFLEDIKDGHYSGWPFLGAIIQKTENPAIRRRFSLPDNKSGVLVTKIIDIEGRDNNLKEKDLILRVDGYVIANDGTIEFRKGERTSANYAIQKYQIGGKVKLEVLREQKLIEVEVELKNTREDFSLVPYYLHDEIPSYFVYGGLVFTTLSVDLLKEWGDRWPRSAPTNLVYNTMHNFKTRDKQEVVVLLNVLSDVVNQGYEDINFFIIDNVNNQKIKSLKQLIEVVENNKEEFVDFSNDYGNSIYLNVKEVQNMNSKILNRYMISKDRSLNYLAVNAK